MSIKYNVTNGEKVDYIIFLILNTNMKLYFKVGTCILIYIYLFCFGSNGQHGFESHLVDLSHQLFH